MYKIVNINELTIRKKMQQTVSYIGHMWDKILEILQYPITWFGGLGLFVLDALAGGKIIIYGCYIRHY